jgi:pimeloyl-ACP methyl ester carboxylesterase
MTPAFADWTPRALPDGSDMTIIEHAGHFLQLDEPEKVAELVPRVIG